MLAQRCVPNETYSTIKLEAEMVGIGGIKEPRKVEAIVGVDPKEITRHIFRTICTWPKPNEIVCRDWMTGKLQTAEFEKTD